ncbi:hypothetical protein KAMFAM_247 [Bacillus phage Kamfam]|nr:hypothetical protein OTK52_245 [Bacillus phage OTooleKemple52]AXQ67085.1 hypothetical protein KAMFAM_247 [Bacillus phage Kamfam]
MLYEIEHEGHIVVTSANARYALETLFNETSVLFDVNDKLPKVKALRVGEVFLLGARTYVTAYEQDMMGGKLV